MNQGFDTVCPAPLPRLRAVAASILASLLLAAPAGSVRAQDAAAGAAPEGGRPDESDVVLPETAEVLFRYAQQAETEGRMSAAAAAYEKFIEKFPKHSQTLEVGYRLGKCLDAVGRVDDAVRRFEEVTKEKDPRFRNRQDALFLLGKLYGDLGEFEKACKVLDRLLGEGAGLYEDEALNLSGGYYALQKKYNEAAGKLNILRRRPDSRFAERASYKLVLIWLEAGNLDLAVDAVGELARQFPQNQDARGLMLRIADVFREQRKFQQAIAICDQLKSAFPDSPEAKGSSYIAGLCYRDQKMPDKAVELLVAAAGVPENVKIGVAAEAMVAAADITLSDRNNVEKAMELYEKAAALGADYPDEERRRKLLERCYFRLAEHNYGQRKWAVALEFYSLMRKAGTEINVLPRIMRCQAELGMDPNAFARGQREIEIIWKKVNDNPGTFIAAEGEVFIADGELNAALEQKALPARIRKCAETYLDILKRYPPAVLAESHLASYVNVQMGRSYAALYDLDRDTVTNSIAWELAVKAFENALSVETNTPYAREALEGIARVGDSAGRPALSFDAYRRLYRLTGEKLKTSGDDKAAKEDSVGYLRSMLSRAGQTETLESAIAMARDVAAREGRDSPAGRHALFYIGELCYAKKDFSAAARAFREFIAAYGPKQNADGDFADGPLRVRDPDEATQQVFDAALRVAHSWYLQGHHQNMIKAYEWMARNVPDGNQRMAEANYWLAMETVKGADQANSANRRKFADLLWTNVVCTAPLREFPAPADGAAQKLYRPWVRDAAMMRYVKVAIVKTGRILSENNEHETAARVFEAYLSLYPDPPPPRLGEPPAADKLGAIARYVLGREYIALGKADRMIAVYRPYLDGMRNDRFRLSGLRYIGYHASTPELKKYGVEAYATILDEYGENRTDSLGRAAPLPESERIRRDNRSWDGFRLPPPSDFDFGQVRYALGFLYWNNGDWGQCIRTLSPFVDSRSIEKSASRPKALFMLGKCHFKLGEYALGCRALSALALSHPNFEAIEEAWARAAWGAMKAGDWQRTIQLHEDFTRVYKQSLYQPQMDLYRAIALLNIPERRREGFDRVSAVARSQTYQDVKAEALYRQGVYMLAVALPEAGGKIGKSDLRTALNLFVASIEEFPSAEALIEAAKCCVELERWTDARGHLEKVIRDFPDAGEPILKKARELMTLSQKEIVKAGSAGGQ